MVLLDKKLTRWRNIGARSGKRAGGGCGETKAVGRQASSGGRRSRGSGGGGTMALALTILYAVESDIC